MPDKVLFENLNDQQIAAVKHFNGPALVVAGPGSGKTRVLTHRVAYLLTEKGVKEDHILCVTFTNKAAGEIKARVKNLISGGQNITWSGTFHSVCARILRKHGKEIGIPNDFVIYDTDDQLSIIKQIIRDFGIDPKKFAPRAILETISSAKSELVDPHSYEGYARGFFQRTAAKVYIEYQKRLRSNHALDFDDLLVETVNLLRESEALLNRYQDQFEFILVDEYQDTNKVQYVLTKTLAAKHKNIFVVGDMSQAIYSFRGADYRNILNFQRDYPDSVIYNLEQNYRSTQIILDAAKNVIKNNSSHIKLDLWTQQDGGDKIINYSGYSEAEEAEFIVTQLLTELTNKQDFKDIAVLYRTNAQSRNIEEALIKSNIPYKIVGGQRFYARKEIKDVIAYLRVIHNPSDGVSWDRIINTPPRGIGDKSKEKLAQNGWDLKELDEKTKLPFSEWNSNKEDYSTLELMTEVLEKSGYIKWLDDKTEENKQRIENIEELKSVASRFMNLEEFLENVALIESSNKTNPDEFNAVTLLTIHASKGLEFPVVFLIGMEEGLFPHSQSLAEIDGIEEERRLCYVAITRAMQKIYLTHAKSRLYFGNIQSNLPSRFLSEIPIELLENVGISFNSDTFNKRNPGVDDFLDDLDYDRKSFSWD